VRSEVVLVLSEAVVDPSVLIPDRQEAAMMLGLKADQFDDEGRRRAIEVLSPLITEEVDVHSVARSIDSPLSAIRMNVGQPEDIKATAAYSLLRLSDWMTEDQRRFLMREIERLRASHVEVFGTNVSRGLRYFGPRHGNNEEQLWLQTRLLLLMNSPHTAVRDNAAKCVGLMVEEGLLIFNPELIDTLLFLASSPLVADRAGAAFALTRIAREEPWGRPDVADVIEALERDASYFVRRSTQPPGESAVHS
jgi:HEAT repeat protein